MPVPIPLIIQGATMAGQMIGQGIQNRNLRRDYQQAEAGVNPVDPGQVAFMNRLRQQEQAFRAGTDPSSAFAAQGVQARTAQTQGNILRTGGPNAVGQMLRAQQVGNQGMAGIGAQAATQGNQLATMQFGLTNMIADKVYQNQQRLRDMAMARLEHGRQNLNNMISGAIGIMPDMTMGMQGGLPTRSQVAATAGASAAGVGGAAMGAAKGMAGAAAAMPPVQQATAPARSYGASIGSGMYSVAQGLQNPYEQFMQPPLPY